MGPRAAAAARRRAPGQRWGRLVTIGLLVTLALRPQVGRGEQTPSEVVSRPTEASAVGSEEEIAAKQAALAAELEEARRQLGTAGEKAQGAIKEQIALLETLDLVYAQQIGALKDAAARAAERREAEKELTALRSVGLREAPPYPLLRLDAAREELDAETKRGKAVEASLGVAEEILQRARELYAERERARREAREALETNDDPAQAAELEAALAVRRLESRVAAEQVRVREMELKNERLARDVGEVRTTLLREKAERLGKAVRFTRESLQDRLVQLEKQEAEVAQALDTAKLELAAAERQWVKVQQRPEGGPAALSEEVEARRLAQQTLQLAVSTLGQRLQRLRELKQVWDRRFQTAAGGVPRSQLSGWEAQTRRSLDELRRDERVQRGRLLDTQNERLSRTEALSAPETPPEAARWIREQQRELGERVRIYQASLASLDEARRLNRQLLRDLQAVLGTITLRERAQQVLESARGVWRYEITSVDDRPITVGKIVIGILLFALGLFLSGYLSRQLGHRLFPRLGVEAGAAAALQSVSFYIFVSLLTLLALHVINVPLTAFTLLGGALAIGLGFGSQNIVNNFISGLILFAERPIRVGDMIEVDGTYGTVERIGPRSTRVRSFNNIHIIVPNSSFLEKNVINWTLSDDQVRTFVSVGVAYGSPTREVARLLRKAVDEHGKILKKPEPTVLFTEFGDNALIFEVHFWIRMRMLMERRLVESDIRHHIDQLFREAGITIAFPQRDIHLDTPVEVRVVAEAADGREAPPLPRAAGKPG